MGLGQLVEREKAGGERGANIYTIVNALPSQVYPLREELLTTAVVVGRAARSILAPQSRSTYPCHQQR